MDTRLAVATLAILLLPLAGCLGSGTSSSAGSNESDGSEGLNPEEPGNPTATPHPHDRWRGQEERVLVNRSVQIEGHGHRVGDDAASAELVCQRCSYHAGFGPDPGKIVPPGAGRVVVSASWENDRMVRLAYRAADQASFHGLGAKESPATWSIDVSDSMTDGGHAPASLWGFRLYSCRECTAIGPDDYLEFPVDVTVRVLRAPGPIPEDPPHPEWWDDGPVRQVWSGQGEVGRIGYGHDNWMGIGEESGGFALAGGWVVKLNGSEHDQIPLGADVLTATVNWTNDQPAADTTPPRPWFKWSTAVQTWHIAEPDSTEQGSYRYEIELQPDMTDGVYRQERSRWNFRFGFTGEPTGRDDPVFGGPLTQPYRIDGTWNLTIRVRNLDG